MNEHDTHAEGRVSLADVSADVMALAASVLILGLVVALTILGHA